MTKYYWKTSDGEHLGGYDICFIQTKTAYSWLQNQAINSRSSANVELVAVETVETERVIS